LTYTAARLPIRPYHRNPNRTTRLTTRSAAFFTFLRANLVLPPSAMSSNVSSPYLEPTTGHSLAPPSPSPLATHVLRSAPSVPSSRASTSGHDDVDSDIPPLTLDILTSKSDKIAALKLVADSVAQQRQQASLALVFHPLCLAVLAALLAVAHHVAWVRRDRDLGTLLTLGSGAVMTYLLAIRYLAGPYIRLAEQVGWSFLLSEDGGEEDLVLGSRYGSEIVAALVLRLEPASAASAAHHHHHAGGGKRKNHHRAANLKGGKGVIRAWTTRLRYRGKGLGGDLLREAVRITKERCGRDAEVGFAREHANSTMVLPEMFNGTFRRSEMRAARALEAVLADFEGGRRKR